MENEPSNQASFSAPRRWGILLAVALGIAAVLAIIVMVNYLALRYPWHVALSPRAETQLRPQTLSLLKYLTNRIEITAFLEKDDVPDLHDLVTAILKEYANASPLIFVREFAPKSDFGAANAALAKYALKPETLTNRNFVLVACGEDTQVLSDNELAELDYEAILTERRKEIGLKNFKGEAAISSAIFRLTNPRKIKAYFLVGQGEHNPESDDPVNGYGQFAEILKKELNIEWAKLDLIGTNEVPADCQLLVIAGPRIKYQEWPLKCIQAYLKSGGRALVMLNNLGRSGRSGIEDVLEKWNVRVYDSMVFDPRYEPYGKTEELLVHYTVESWSHPVTKPLLGLDDSLRIRLVKPRIVEPLKGAVNALEAPQAVCLASTWTNGSYAVAVSETGEARPNPMSDPKNIAFPLIAAVEQGGIPGVRAQRNTRLVVAGDSICFANALIEQAANPYFARLAVNWLVDRRPELLEGLAPRPLNQYRITLSKTSWRQLNWLLLAALPGGVLMFGSLVWLRRRS